MWPLLFFLFFFSFPLFLCQDRFSTGGSSLAASFFQDQMFAYNLRHPAVRFSYVSSDSSTGRSSALQGLSDFGASDSSLSSADYLANPGGFALPAIAAGIVPVYNLPMLKNNASLTLRLSRSTLAGIFLNTIQWWNDSAIAASNPLLAQLDLLPSERIRVVVRAESSGTSRIFTSGLGQFSSDFLNSGIIDKAGQPVIAGLESPQWTMKFSGSQHFFTASGNVGIVNLVAGLPYSIGYAALSSAASRGLDSAIMENKAGQWVAATSESVEFAVLDSIVTKSAGPEDLPSPTNLNPLVLVDSSGRSAWPLAGVSFFIFQGFSKDSCTRRQRVYEFLLDFYNNAKTREIASNANFTVFPEVVSRTLGIFSVINARLACEGNRSSQLKFLEQSSVKPLAGSLSALSFVRLLTFSNPNEELRATIMVTSSQQALELLTAPTPLIGAGLVIHSQVSAALLPPAQRSVPFTSFPVFLLPVVPLYSIPSAFLSFSGVSPPSLIVDMDLLGQIFTGELRNWGDGRISAINKNLNNGMETKALPITIIISRGNEGEAPEATNLVAQTLARFSPSFARCFPAVFSPSVIVEGFNFFTHALPGCGPNHPEISIHSVPSESLIASTVAVIPGAIGFSIPGRGFDAQAIRILLRPGAGFNQSALSPDDYAQISLLNPFQARVMTFESPAKTPAGVAELAACLAPPGAIAVSSDERTITVDTAASSNPFYPFCWPFMDFLSVIIPGTPAQPPSTASACRNSEATLDYFLPLFTDSTGQVFFKGFSYGLFTMAPPGEFGALVPGFESNGKTEKLYYRISQALACKPNIFFPGDQLKFSLDPPMAVLAFIFSVLGSWISLILVEQAIFDRKTRFLSGPFWVSLVVSALSLSLVAIWVPYLVSLNEFDYPEEFSSVQFDIDLCLTAILPPFILTAIAYFLMLTNIPISARSERNKAGEGSGTPGPSDSGGENSLPFNEKERSASRHSVSAPGSQDSVNSVEALAVDLFSANAVLRELFRHFNLKTLVAQVLLLGGKIVCLVMQEEAYRTTMRVKYSSENIQGAVIAGFFLTALGLLAFFHLLRYRFIAAFVMGSGFFAVSQLITAGHQYTVNLDQSPTLREGRWSQATVTLLAILVGAVASFIFLGLQFSRMKLSRNQLDWIVRRMKKETTKLKSRYEAVQVRNASLEDRLEVCKVSLSLINQARPLFRPVDLAIQLIDSQMCNFPRIQAELAMAASAISSTQLDRALEKLSSAKPRASSIERDAKRLATNQRLSKKAPSTIHLPSRGGAESLNETLSWFANPTSRPNALSESDSKQSEIESVRVHEEASSHRRSVSQAEQILHSQTTNPLSPISQLQLPAGVRFSDEPTGSPRMPALALAGLNPPDLIDREFGDPGTARFPQPNRDERLAYLAFLVSSLHNTAQNSDLTQKLAESVPLKTVLAHPLCLELFKDACLKELSPENLAFYLAVQHYRTLKPDKQTRRLLADEIGRDFIMDTARFQVNLPGQIRSLVIAQLKAGNYSSTMFDDSAGEILRLISNDSYSRFTMAPQFIICWMILSSQAAADKEKKAAAPHKRSHSESAEESGGEGILGQLRAMRPMAAKIKTKFIARRMPAPVASNEVDEEKSREFPIRSGSLSVPEPPQPPAKPLVPISDASLEIAAIGPDSVEVALSPNHEE